MSVAEFVQQTLETDGPQVTWQVVRRALGKLAAVNREWAGIPLAIDGARLKLESKYPWKRLDGAILGASADEPPADFELRNHWTTKDADVYVVTESDGRVKGYRVPFRNERLCFQMRTFSALTAWDMDSEAMAMGKLKALLERNKKMWKAYVMTGAFLETSPRSHVTYVFRRLRPTIAMKPDADGSSMHILASLCLHPIGYYEGTHAGVMVPTDDVIAHLLLMRGDEHRFWRMANQHPAWHPQAQI